MAEARIEIDGNHLEALLDDMDAALRELLEPLERDPILWDRGVPGKWTAGQHVDHVSWILGLSAERLERNAEELLRGTLARRPWRDPLQAWFVHLVTGPRFPKGGKAIRETRPAPRPEPGEALERLRNNAARHRAVAAKLTPEQRDRLWFWNPFIRLPWHYTFPEVIRVQANHARLHAAGVKEALGLGPS